MATDDRSTDRRRTGDDHVCAFCRETFDVSEQTTCPSCEAVLVLWGAR